MSWFGSLAEREPITWHSVTDNFRAARVSLPLPPAQSTSLAAGRMKYVEFDRHCGIASAAVNLHPRLAVAQFHQVYPHHAAQKYTSVVRASSRRYLAATGRSSRNAARM